MDNVTSKFHEIHYIHHCFIFLDWESKCYSISMMQIEEIKSTCVYILHHNNVGINILKMFLVLLDNLFWLGNNSNIVFLYSYTEQFLIHTILQLHCSSYRCFIHLYNINLLPKVTSVSSAFKQHYNVIFSCTFHWLL